MKKFYKLALALAISIGSVSAFAVGTADDTDPTGVNSVTAKVEVYAVGNIVYVNGAEGQVITVVGIVDKISVTGVVNGGQFENTKIEGIAVVQVAGVSETVYLTK